MMLGGTHTSRRANLNSRYSLLFLPDALRWNASLAEGGCVPAMMAKLNFANDAIGRAMHLANSGWITRRYHTDAGRSSFISAQSNPIIEE